jgi:hypothetical protein
MASHLGFALMQVFLYPERSAKDQDDRCSSPHYAFPPDPEGLFALDTGFNTCPELFIRFIKIKLIPVITDELF